MQEEMNNKFSHMPERRQGPNLGGILYCNKMQGKAHLTSNFIEEGFAHEEGNSRMHKRKRMDNNAEHNRNKKNRRQSPDNNRREQHPQRHIPEHRKRPCIFYMQGKCHKVGF